MVRLAVVAVVVVLTVQQVQLRLAVLAVQDMTQLHSWAHQLPTQAVAVVVERQAVQVALVVVVVEQQTAQPTRAAAVAETMQQVLTTAVQAEAELLL